MSQSQDPHLFALRQRHDNHQRFGLQQHAGSAVHPYTYSHTQTPYLAELSEDSSGGNLSSNSLLRKGRWSPSEDERLRNSIRRHGANK